MHSVYMITNSQNSMKYIGVTCRPVSIRFKEHIYSAQGSESNAPLHTAMRDLGVDTFSCQILEDDISSDDARSKELYYIRKFNTCEPFGYNTYKAGMGGRCHTDVGRKHISKSLQGIVYLESRNAKISIAHTNIVKSETWCNNISKSRKGKYAKENNGFYGKHHSQETISRITNSRKLSVTSDVIYHSEKGDTLVFKSLSDAGKWVMRSGLSNTSFRTCAERISRTIRYNSDHIVYGGHWEFKQRSID